MTTNTNNNYSVKELVAKYRNYVIENAPKKFTEKDIIELTATIGENEIKKHAKILKCPLKLEDEDPDCQLLFSLCLNITDISPKERTLCN